MFKQFIGALFHLPREKASQFAALPVFSHSMVKGFMTTAHHTLMLVGAGALIAIAIVVYKPNIAVQLKAFSPFAAAIATEVAVPQLVKLKEAPSQPVTLTGSEKTTTTSATTPREEPVKMVRKSLQQQQWVTNWLSKRYRVAGDATNMLVSAAYVTAEEIKLDPLLILAVMAIESGFNPFAESPVGAQGLMQVMSKIHHAKFQDLGGVKAALNPIANIKVGALILKDYVTRGGSVEAGLKFYVGAAAFETDSGYGHKVLGEYRRLKEVAMGKKVPMFSTGVVKTAQKLSNPVTRNEQKNTTAPVEDKSASADQQVPPLGKAMQVAEL